MGGGGGGQSFVSHAMQFSFLSNMFALILLYVCVFMLTCPWNVCTLTPHFYIVKLEFTGVYLIIIILFALKHSTHNLCFRAKIRNIMYTPVNPSFTI